MHRVHQYTKILFLGLSIALLVGCTLSSSVNPDGTGNKQGTSISPIPKQDDNPNSISPGPGEPALKVLKTGEGTVSGFINSPGDVDYFQLELVGGVTYGLQMFNFPSYGLPTRNVFTILDSSGDHSFQSTSDIPWPNGVAEDLHDLRTVWTTPYTGTYYLEIQNELLSGISSYKFNLTGSQLGYGHARETITNYRSYQLIVDDSDNVLYEGPTPANRTDGQPRSYLTGSIASPSLSVYKSLATINSIYDVYNEFYFDFEVPEPVFFYNQDGYLNEAPETPAAHIHWGIPSSDYSDSQDDIEWVYDSTHATLALGPNNTTFPNKNDTSGNSPHNFVMNITDFEGSLPQDIMHLLLGHDWYIDAHYHSRFESDPTPLVASRAQGGFSMFDSRFVLNGYETVPPTGSIDALEVYYSDEHRVFYIPYGYDAGDLKGQSIHVHSGAPGEMGEVLIDLGSVPAPLTRPVYEPELTPLNADGTNRFTPGVENILKRLTNEEAQALKKATFTTGWYLDLHLPPFFIDYPLIRTDAILYDNWEIVTRR